MTRTVEEHLESTQNLVEEAKKSVKKGKAFAKASNRMGNAEDIASGTFDDLAEGVGETRQEYADRAIDAFKDAYLEAHQAYVLAEGTSGLDDIQGQLQNIEGGQEIMDETDFEATDVDRRDIHKSRIQAERIMSGLQEKYGEALDFDGYLEKVMYHEE